MYNAQQERVTRRANRIWDRYYAELNNANQMKLKGILQKAGDDLRLQLKNPGSCCMPKYIQIPSSTVQIDLCPTRCGDSKNTKLRELEQQGVPDDDDDDDDDMDVFMIDFDTLYDQYSESGGINAAVGFINDELMMNLADDDDPNSYITAALADFIYYDLGYKDFLFVGTVMTTTSLALEATATNTGSHTPSLSSTTGSSRPSSMSSTSSITKSYSGSNMSAASKDAPRRNASSEETHVDQSSNSTKVPAPSPASAAVSTVVGNAIIAAVVVIGFTLA